MCALASHVPIIINKSYKWMAHTYQGCPTSQRGGWGIVSTLPEKSFVESYSMDFNEMRFHKKYFPQNDFPIDAGKLQREKSK